MCESATELSRGYPVGHDLRVSNLTSSKYCLGIIQG
jgi:hypothetical protein